MKNEIINKLLHSDMAFKCRWYRYWNIVKMRLLGVKLGKGASMMNKVYVHVDDGAKVMIGSHFAINSGDNTNPLCGNSRCSIYVAEGAKLTIGDWSGISRGCLWATDNISIGNHVNIGANCVIMDGDMHNTNWRLRHNDRQFGQSVPFKKRPIVIEDDVWLGANCLILKGVTIGANSIVGAGSVVTKDIPADCIAAGNPCKIIKVNTQIDSKS